VNKKKESDIGSSQCETDRINKIEAMLSMLLTQQANQGFGNLFIQTPNELNKTLTSCTKHYSINGKIENQ
jgi:hypothetical protein